MAGNDIILPIYKNRGETIGPNDIVRLRAVFKDPSNAFIDLDAFPQVSIMTPTGLVSLPPTSTGVIRESVGHYLFEYHIGYDGPFGVWNDNWTGTINGFPISSSFSFIVSYTDLPGINTDGFMKLGDDPGFHYSQTAIFNINKLMKTLRRRLNSDGKSKKTDANGNIVYVDCNIFSVDMLTTFLATSLTDFNSVPYFTSFTFEDTMFLDQYHEIIVEGATLQALVSKALIERGREFSVTDNSISFTPPTVSEMLNSQYSSLLTHYYDKLKYIKNSMRPAAAGLGVLRPIMINQRARMNALKRQGRLY